MTDLVLKGPQPFDLIPQRDATAVAEGENVNMTLPVFALGFPENAAQIRLSLTPGQALQIVEQLQGALTIARAYGRRPS
jgi:hypothetical protein